MEHQNFHYYCENKKNLIIILIVILSIFLFVLTISNIVSIQNKIKQGRYIGQDVESRNTISVAGAGEVYTKPDLALISFSVVIEAKTVGEAMSQNTEKMNNIISFIKEQGVEDKDLKTTSFNIYPRYDYNRASSIYPSGKRVLVGYEVSQQLQVKIRDLDKTGQIIEGAANKGANQVGNLQFTVENEDDFKKQARKEAIEEAKTKAEELAGQLGVKLIRIINFSEGGYVPMLYSESVMKGMGVGSPDIEIGENKISITVNITYEIN